MKFKNGWYLIEEETDMGYDLWNTTQPWQDGLMFKTMSYCNHMRTAIDIGCAYGATTLPLAKNFNHVHSFDMNKTLSECFVKNTSGFNNITHYVTGLTDKDEKRTAFFAKWSGYSTLRENQFETLKTNLGGYKEEVSCTFLDKFQIEDVDLLKIDAEGEELSILRGARYTIGKYKPVVVLENGKNKREQEFISALHDIIGYIPVENWRYDTIFIHPNLLKKKRKNNLTSFLLNRKLYTENLMEIK